MYALVSYSLELTKLIKSHYLTINSFSPILYLKTIDNESKICLTIVMFLHVEVKKQSGKGFLYCFFTCVDTLFSYKL